MDRARTVALLAWRGYAPALCLLYFLTLLLLGSFHELGGYGVETDFYNRYAPHARDLLEGRPFRGSFYPPGLPAILAFLHPAFGDLFAAGKIISAVSAALLGLVVHRTLNAIFGARVAGLVLPVFLVAILRFALVASTDMLFCLLLWLSVHFSLRNEEPEVRDILISGAAAGLAYLTRYSGVFLVLAFYVYVAFMSPRAVRWGTRLRRLGLFTAAFLVAASPWLVASWRLHGNPFHNKAYAYVAADVYHGSQNMGVITRMARRFSSLSEVILNEPRLFAGHYVSNVFHHFNKFMTTLLLLPAYLLALPGLLHLVRERNRRGLALLGWFAVGLLFQCLAFYNTRFFLPFLPMVLAPAIYFLYGPRAESWSLRLHRRVVSLNALLLGLVFLVHLAVSVPLTHRLLTTEPTHLRAMADAVRPKLGDGEVLMTSQKPHFAFLAGIRAPVRSVPRVETLDELLAAARRRNATLLMVGHAEVTACPALAPLVEGSTHPGLAPVHSFRDPPMTLYRIVQIAGVG